MAIGHLAVRLLALICMFSFLSIKLLDFYVVQSILLPNSSSIITEAELYSYSLPCL